MTVDTLVRTAPPSDLPSAIKPDTRTPCLVDIVEIRTATDPTSNSAAGPSTSMGCLSLGLEGKRILSNVIMSAAAAMSGGTKAGNSKSSTPAASRQSSMATLPPSDVEDESDESDDMEEQKDIINNNNSKPTADLMMHFNFDEEDEEDDQENDNSIEQQQFGNGLLLIKTSSRTNLSSSRRSTRKASSRGKSRSSSSSSSSSSRGNSLAQFLKTPSAKATLVIALLMVVIVTLVLTFIPDSPIRGMLMDFLLWIRHIDPLLASIIVAFVYVVSLVFCAPVTPLNLASGFLFQLWLGSAVSIIGCMLGSLVAFFAGRFMVRGWVASWARDNPRFRAIDKAVENEGFKLVVLVRLSPILPFPLLNYFFGATKISLLKYSLGTLIGIAPFTCVYAYFGSILREISDIWQENTQDLLTRCAWIFVTIITTVITIVFVLVLTKRALRRAMKDYVTATTDVFDDDSLFDLERFAAAAAAKASATISDKQSNLSDDDSELPSPDSATPRRVIPGLGDIVIDDSVSIDITTTTTTTTSTTDRSRPFHL